LHLVSELFSSCLFKEGDNHGKESQTDSLGIDEESQTEPADLTNGNGPLITIQRLKDNSELLQYYTGLIDYDHFLYVFHSLGPAAENLKYR
jgi:hypothetical protein